MNKLKITFNAISAIVQVVIVGLVYLILYKFILAQIGVKLLGVWSLIIASTSVVSVANFGISSSIVKFVSTYYSRQRTDLIIKLIFTSLIFIVSTYVLISMVIYFLGTYLLHFIIDKEYINLAINLLPFSLISLILNAISGVFNSAIDGIQKNYIKSYIISFSSIVLLFLSIILTPKFGILGLVYAQIFQSTFVVLLTIFSFKKLFHISFNFRWNWDGSLFKEIFNYGIKVQVSSIIEMTSDPITKFLLSKFGGLTMVGYYEMASRLVVQFRSLIVSANQVTIPIIAEAKEHSLSNIINFYKKQFSIVLYLNIIMTTFIIASAPVISLVWIGQYNSLFVNILIINSISIFFNISSTPAYFSYMGEGKLNWVVMSSLISFSSNIILGYLLGLNFGGIGVIIASCIALILNSILLQSTFLKYKEIKIFTLISHYDLKLIITSIIFIFYSNYLLYSIYNHNAPPIQMLFYIFFLLLFVFYIVKNQTFIILKALFLNLFTRIKS